MRKAVINTQREGLFELSDKAFELLIEKGWTVFQPESVDGLTFDKSKINVDGFLILDCIKFKAGFEGRYDFCGEDLPLIGLRTHRALIDVIEELGKEANTDNCTLKIIEIPKDMDAVILEKSGHEWIIDAERVYPSEIDEFTFSEI